MGVGVSFIGLLILVGGIVLVVMAIGAVARGFRRPRLGHVTLSCPHCSAETRADLPTCQQCGEDL